MTVRSAILTVLGLAISGVATAAEEPAISSTKTSAMPEVITKSYASVTLRHATRDKFADDGSSNIVPTLYAIPTLGTKLLDDKLDLSYTWFFSKKADSARVSKNVSYAEVTYTVLDTKHATLFPYLYVEQADGESFSTFDVGPHLDLKTEVTTPVGALALSGFFEPLVELTSGSRAAKAPVHDRTSRATEGIYLVDGSKQESTASKEIEAKHASYYSTTEVGAKLAVDAVKGLSVGTGVDFLQNWTPHYAATDDTGDTRYNLDGYTTKSAVMNKVSVSYKLTDAITIANQVRYMVDGFYSDRYAGQSVTGVSARIENRLTMVATLF